MPDQKQSAVEEIKRTLAEADRQRKEQRFVFGWNNLLAGDSSILRNSEFYGQLSERLQSASCDYPGLDLRLIACLVSASTAGDILVRERAVLLLARNWARLLACCGAEGAERYLEGLSQWLTAEREYFDSLTTIFTHLREVLQYLLLREDFPSAIHLTESVDLLSRQTGKDREAFAIRSEELLDNVFSESVVGRIITRAIDEGVNKQSSDGPALKMLRIAGGHAIPGLMKRLIGGRLREERLFVIQILAEFGEQVGPALEQVLLAKPDWPVVRNMVSIVTVSGRPELFPLIEPLLVHDELRVQQEVLRCLVKISGTHLRERLFQAFEIVSDELKVHVLRQLITLKVYDDRLLTLLMRLSDERGRFEGQVRRDLVAAIVVCLGNFVNSESINILNVVRREAYRHDDTELAELTNDSLRQVVPRYRSGKKLRDVHANIDGEFGRFYELQSYSRIQSVEAEVAALLGSRKNREAVKLMITRAEQAVREKDFFAAEAFRDRALDINPSSLKEVMALSEYIDEEKDNGSFLGCGELWPWLEKNLTNRDLDSLFSAMRTGAFNQGELVVEKGEADACLYFVTSGSLAMQCKVGARDVFLKKLGPGAVFGWEQFQQSSVWTVTVKVLSDANLQLLSFPDYQRVLLQAPFVGRVLEAQSGHFVSVPDLLRISGEDRREFPRYPVTLQTRNCFLDSFGQPGSRIFRGVAVDISRGGTAFILKVARSEQARGLLGRRLKVGFYDGDYEGPGGKGSIVGVQSRRLNDRDVSGEYVINVRLAQPLDEVSLKKVLSLSR